MKALLVFISCVIIMLNTVPRLNDTHFTFKEISVRKWLRFFGLVLTAASALWLCYAVSVPSNPFAAESVVGLLCGVAISWTSSPLVGNWIEFVFRVGGDQRYETLNRRKEDK